MAEGGNLVDGDTNADLTCTVCLETYKNPKVLPCLHSFCIACLERILLEQDKSKATLGDFSYRPLSVENLPAEENKASDGLIPLDLSEPKAEPLTPEPEGPLTPGLVLTDEPTEGVESATEQDSADLPEADIGFSVTTEERLLTEIEPLTFSAGIEASFQETICITCPICKAEHPVPGGRVEELPDDYERLDRLEKNVIKQSLVKKELKCIQCSSEESVVEYCLDCSGGLCDFCVKAHKRQKIYNDHSVVPHDKLSPEHLVSPKKQKMCKNHNEAFIFFCNDCKQLICPSCFVSVTGHRKHDFVRFEEADEVCHKRVQELVRASEQNLKTFHGHKDYLQGIEKAVVTSSHTEQLTKRINHEFDACIENLQERRGYLLAKAEEVGNMSKKGLWSQKDFVERTITKIQSGVMFAQRAQRCSNLEERIVMNTQAISRLCEVFEDSWDQTAIQSPMVFKLSKQQPSIDSLASWGELSLLSNDDITLDNGLEATCTVCQQSLVTVKFHVDPLSLPSFQILYGKSQQILDTNEVVIYESEEDSCYNVEFVPRVAGNHVLEIWLAGVSVGRKTFSVAGRPRVGNSVQVGPDWNGEITGIRLGKVTESRLRKVTVDWGDAYDNQMDYKWGDDGLYEVELVP